MVEEPVGGTRVSHIKSEATLGITNSTSYLPEDDIFRYNYAVFKDWCLDCELGLCNGVLGRSK